LTQFNELGLKPALLKSIETLGFTEPTPIQSAAIPHALEGRDVLGLAQTGTGKTAAFALPLIDRLMESQTKLAPKQVRGLILAPTRELAQQIANNLRDLNKLASLRITVVVGGASLEIQRRNLQRGTDILVATPGRLWDLVERRALDLTSARFLVLDEADQMLDLGFIHTLRKIAAELAKPRQTMLFSATMPKAIEELSRAYQNDPIRVEVSPPGRAADKIRQTVHHTVPQAKSALLKKLLGESPDALSLVFARTKHGAERLMKGLVAGGFEAVSVHGNKSQGQRERAVRAFRTGQARVLVATDVAARGIDIPDVTHVYNYDLPEVPESYIHRIGRTARAGAEGEAVAFCTADDVHLLHEIQRLTGLPIEIVSGQEPASVKRSKGGSRGRGGRPSGRSPAGSGNGANRNYRSEPSRTGPQGARRGDGGRSGPPTRHGAEPSGANGQSGKSGTSDASKSETRSGKKPYHRGQGPKPDTSGRRDNAHADRGGERKDASSPKRKTGPNAGAKRHDGGSRGANGPGPAGAAAGRNGKPAGKSRVPAKGPARPGHQAKRPSRRTSAA